MTQSHEVYRADSKLAPLVRVLPQNATGVSKTAIWSISWTCPKLTVKPIRKRLAGDPLETLGGEQFLDLGDVSLV
jgi:hypothetical protein